MPAIKYRFKILIHILLIVSLILNTIPIMADTIDPDFYITHNGEAPSYIYNNKTVRFSQTNTLSINICFNISASSTLEMKDGSSNVMYSKQYSAGSYSLPYELSGGSYMFSIKEGGTTKKYINFNAHHDTPSQTGSTYTYVSNFVEINKVINVSTSDEKTITPDYGSFSNRIAFDGSGNNLDADSLQKFFEVYMELKTGNLYRFFGIVHVSVFDQNSILQGVYNCALGTRDYDQGGFNDNNLTYDNSWGWSGTTLLDFNSKAQWSRTLQAPPPDGVSVIADFAMEESKILHIAGTYFVDEVNGVKYPEAFQVFDKSRITIDEAGKQQSFSTIKNFLNEKKDYTISFERKSLNTSIVDDADMKSTTAPDVWAKAIAPGQTSISWTVNVLDKDGNMKASSNKTKPVTVKTSTPVENELPTAIINAPQYALVGETITADGSKSYASFGKKLTNYKWHVKQGGKVLADSEGETLKSVDFVCDSTQEINITLEVTESDGDKASATATIQGDSMPNFNVVPKMQISSEPLFEGVKYYVSNATTIDGTLYSTWLTNNPNYYIEVKWNVTPLRNCTDIDYDFSNKGGSVAVDTIIDRNLVLRTSKEYKIAAEVDHEITVALYKKVGKGSLKPPPAHEARGLVKTPISQFSISGEKKENRKLTFMDNSLYHRKYPQQTYEYNIKNTDRSEQTTISALKTSTLPYVANNPFSSNIVDLLLKVTNNYTVIENITDTRGYSDTTSQSIFIKPDLPPVAKASYRDMIYRNPTTASTTITDQSFSQDGDILNSRNMKSSYDANNNGNYSDDAQTDHGGAASNTISSSKVGRIRVILNVIEDFINTIAAKLLPGDKRSASRNIDITVDNIRPVTSFSAIQESTADIKLTSDNSSYRDVNGRVGTLDSQLRNDANKLVNPSINLMGIDTSSGGAVKTYEAADAYPGTNTIQYTIGRILAYQSGGNMVVRDMNTGTVLAVAPAYQNNQSSIPLHNFNISLNFDFCEGERYAYLSDPVNLKLYKFDTENGTSEVYSFTTDIISQYQNQPKVIGQENNGNTVYINNYRYYSLNLNPADGSISINWSFSYTYNYMDIFTRAYRYAGRLFMIDSRNGRILEIYSSMQGNSLNVWYETVKAGMYPQIRMAYDPVKPTGAEYCTDLIRNSFLKLQNYAVKDNVAHMLFRMSYTYGSYEDYSLIYRKVDITTGAVLVQKHLNSALYEMPLYDTHNVYYDDEYGWSSEHNILRGYKSSGTREYYFDGFVLLRNDAVAIMMKKVMKSDWYSSTFDYIVLDAYGNVLKGQRTTDGFTSNAFGLNSYYNYFPSILQGLTDSRPLDTSSYLGAMNNQDYTDKDCYMGINGYYGLNSERKMEIFDLSNPSNGIKIPSYNGYGGSNIPVYNQNSDDRFYCMNVLVTDFPRNTFFDLESWMMEHTSTYIYKFSRYNLNPTLIYAGAGYTQYAYLCGDKIILAGTGDIRSVDFNGAAAVNEAFGSNRQYVGGSKTNFAYKNIFSSYKVTQGFYTEFAKSLDSMTFRPGSKRYINVVTQNVIAYDAAKTQTLANKIASYGAKTIFMGGPNNYSLGAVLVSLTGGTHQYYADNGDVMNRVRDYVLSEAPGYTKTDTIYLNVGDRFKANINYTDTEGDPCVWTEYRLNGGAWTTTYPDHFDVPGTYYLECRQLDRPDTNAAIYNEFQRFSSPALLTIVVGGVIQPPPSKPPVVDITVKSSLGENVGKENRRVDFIVSAAEGTNAINWGTYRVNFGANDFLPYTAPNTLRFSRVFSTTGTHSVTVELTDTAGLKTTKTAYFTINADTPPTAAFTVSGTGQRDSSGIATFSLTSTASSLDDTIGSVEYFINDGSGYRPLDVLGGKFSLNKVYNHTVMQKVTETYVNGIGLNGENLDLYRAFKSSAATRSANVLNTAPTLGYTVSPGIIQAGQIVGHNTVVTDETPTGDTIKYKFVHTPSYYQNNQGLHPQNNVETTNPTTKLDYKGKYEFYAMVTDENGANSAWLNGSSVLVCTSPVSDFELAALTSNNGGENREIINDVFMTGSAITVQNKSKNDDYGNTVPNRGIKGYRVEYRHQSASAWNILCDYGNSGTYISDIDLPVLNQRGVYEVRQTVTSPEGFSNVLVKQFTVVDARIQASLEPSAIYASQSYKIKATLSKDATGAVAKDHAGNWHNLSPISEDAQNKYYEKVITTLDTLLDGSYPVQVYGMYPFGIEVKSDLTLTVNTPLTIALVLNPIYPNGIPASENLQVSVTTDSPVEPATVTVQLEGEGSIQMVKGTRAVNVTNWLLNYNVRDTKPDRDYYNFTAAAALPNAKKVHQQDRVKVLTPINLAPEIASDIIIEETIAISSTTSKYANTCKVVLFKETEWEQALDMTGVTSGNIKNWTVSYLVPADLPEGDYFAEFTATTPNGNIQTVSVPIKALGLKLENLRITNITDPKWKDYFVKPGNNVPTELQKAGIAVTDMPIYRSKEHNGIKLGYKLYLEIDSAGLEKSGDTVEINARYFAMDDKLNFYEAELYIPNQKGDYFPVSSTEFRTPAKNITLSQPDRKPSEVNPADTKRNTWNFSYFIPYTAKLVPIGQKYDPYNDNSFKYKLLVVFEITGRRAAGQVYDYTLKENLWGSDSGSSYGGNRLSGRDLAGKGEKHGEVFWYNLYETLQDDINVERKW